MKLNHTSIESLALQFTENRANNESLVQQLLNQHAMVSNKLLPEIDMHFWSLAKNNALMDHSEIKQVYQLFEAYKNQLEDHFYFEEIFVFPALLQEQIERRQIVLDFVQKHEDFELLLGKMIVEIQEKLEPLRGHMSLRMLEIKLATLVEVMEEHQLLEDTLFAEL
jgi:iron-sulfur cluster repair protein YtfE (RIC family)